VCALDFDFTLRVESEDGVYRNLGAPEGDDVVQTCIDSGYVARKWLGA
jgi:hypothetical protein